MEDFSAEGLKRTAREQGVPEHVIDGFVAHIRTGRETGDFITSVLCNDLRVATVRADPTNRLAMYQIVIWLFNFVPNGCWGSVEEYRNWRAIGGLEGVEASLATTDETDAEAG